MSAHKSKSNGPGRVPRADASDWRPRLAPPTGIPTGRLGRTAAGKSFGQPPGAARIGTADNTPACPTSPAFSKSNIKADFFHDRARAVLLSCKPSCHAVRTWTISGETRFYRNP